MKLHNDAKIDRLKEVPLFSQATKDGLQHLASAADEITVSAGQKFITQGSLTHEAYVILSGSVAVAIDGESIATIPAGEIVGELGLFGHHHASATVSAVDAVELLSIPYNRFDQIMDDNPAMVKAMAKELAGRLYRMDARLSDEHK